MATRKQDRTGYEISAVLFLKFSKDNQITRQEKTMGVPISSQLNFGVLQGFLKQKKSAEVFGKRAAWQL